MREPAESLAERVAAATPPRDRRTLDHDLERIGGFGEAVYRAVRHVLAGMRVQPPPGNLLVLCDACATGTWLAESCGITVCTHPGGAVPAMLVESVTQRVIWVDESLPPRKRSFAVLHELAHWLLDHRPNTLYGVNPARLCDAEVAGFERQEREADAYARVLEVVLSACRGEASPAPEACRPATQRRRRTLPARVAGRAGVRRPGAHWQGRRVQRIFTPAQARITRTGLDCSDGQAFLSHGRVRRRDLRGLPRLHVLRAARGAARAEVRQAPLSGPARAA